MMRSTLYLVGSLYFLIGQATALELESVDHWLQRPETQREESYLFVRCAGLYAGVLQYSGSGLGAEATESYQHQVVLLSTRAAVLRASKNGAKPIEFVPQVISDRDRIAKTYLERMKANYAATGQAVMGDELLKGDLVSCNAFSKLIMPTFDH